MPSLRADNPWPNRIAKLLAAVVFPLIWMGGLVTTSDAGMAVPDWPNTYNYNMFAYPIRDWILGPWDLFVEHGHRLLGSLSGVIAIGLCAATYWCDRRPLTLGWSLLILGLVIVQGVLGGQRVIYDARAIALIHGCLGPAFFATVAAMIAMTSAWWRSGTGRVEDRRRISTQFVSGAAILLVVASYAQLVLGACMRHIPDMASPASFSLLVLAHVATGVVVGAIALAGGFGAMKGNWRGSGARWSAILLGFLALFQIGLGATAYILKFGWPAWFANVEFAARFVIPEKSFLQVNFVTLHMAVGSLILAGATYHCFRVFRAVALSPSEP
jgi:cytochrome c oxidase assembly protein subunit 15